MSRLTDLLRAAKQLDPQLGEDLELESISRIDGKLRVLDFKLAAVRSAVLDARDADDAYRSHQWSTSERSA